MMVDSQKLRIDRDEVYPNNKLRALLTRWYYSCKPFMSPGTRLSVRRWLARRVREACGDVWPIEPSAATPPTNWPGWPEGKRFAFVLTHDVEGQRGLDRCSHLAALDQSLGFRASFNFVPEGEYDTPAALRDWLTVRGFEVGVHDLYHDGKLYRSRAEFSRRAARVNTVLKKWGAVGFRSGFMLRRLEWLHELEVAYDASTFDTDPFEPQPEGVGTIFPFWVSASGEKSDNAQAGRGYVELPYTLPQDFTLFVLLQESTIELWKRKLDWVAENGGMALVTVHPDYVQLPGEPASSRTYPVDRMAELLEYVRARYAGQYWQPLPRELAAFYLDSFTDKAQPAATGRKGAGITI